MKLLDLTKPIESCDPERPLIGQPGVYAGELYGSIEIHNGVCGVIWGLDGIAKFASFPNIRNTPKVEVMWAASGDSMQSAWHDERYLRVKLREEYPHIYTSIIRRTRRLDTDGKQIGPAEYVEEEV